MINIFKCKDIPKTRYNVVFLNDIKMETDRYISAIRPHTQ
ncbi:hypothetical protein MHK_010659, partial [Candidatus Magnetomorum sp. HK-1]